VYEFWLTRWQLLVADLSTLLPPYIVPLLVLFLVIAYVFARIYDIKLSRVLFKPRRLALLIALLATPFLALPAIYFFAPEKMGFAVGGGKLVVDVGWWDVPSSKVYNLSHCRLDWVNASSVKVGRVGYGGAMAAIGKLRILPSGVEGYGMVVRGAEWILVARCPDATYILGAPGLNPRVIHD